MDKIINKLSEIEQDSNAIMEAANARKKEFADQMKQKTVDYDTALEAKTAEEIADLKSRMERSMQDKLNQQKKEAQETLKQMEEYYKANHHAYADELFQSMIKE